MLKTNSNKIDLILERLQVKKSSSKDIVLKMNAFCDVAGQKVSVRSHGGNHISEYHTHEFFEINYVYSGSCINLVEDENIIMNTGDMIIIHPGAFHTLYADDDCKVYNFLIEKEWLYNKIGCIIPTDSTMFSFLESAPHDDYYKYLICPHTQDAYNSLTPYAERIIELSLSNSSWKYLLQEAAMIEYLCTIGQKRFDCRLSDGKGASSYKMINFLIYMSEKYDTITLDELSEKFFYSKTHICRLFLQNTGKSFNQTLIDMKLSRACYFLKNTDMTVDEIAHKVGYGSVEHFQRLFKKKNGKTPGEFRKSMNNKL